MTASGGFPEKSVIRVATRPGSTAFTRCGIALPRSFVRPSNAYLLREYGKYPEDRPWARPEDTVMIDPRLLAEVRGDRAGPPARLADRRRGVLDLLRAPCDDGHAGPFLRVADCDGPADSSAAASHDGRPPFQAHFAHPPAWSEAPSRKDPAVR